MSQIPLMNYICACANKTATTLQVTRKKKGNSKRLALPRYCLLVCQPLQAHRHPRRPRCCALG